MFIVLNNTRLADELNADPNSALHLERYGYWEDDDMKKRSSHGNSVGQ